LREHLPHDQEEGLNHGSDARPHRVAMEDGERAGLGGWTCDACPMGVKTVGAGLRRLADVAMVQAADFGKLPDLPRRREFDGLPPGASLSSVRCVRAP
jgi:hypothetical protein